MEIDYKLLSHTHNTVRADWAPQFRSPCCVGQTLRVETSSTAAERRCSFKFEIPFIGYRGACRGRVRECSSDWVGVVACVRRSGRRHGSGCSVWIAATLATVARCCRIVVVLDCASDVSVLLPLLRTREAKDPPRDTMGAGQDADVLLAEAKFRALDTDGSNVL